jgi:outer membrane autotransporter protein
MKWSQDCIGYGGILLTSEARMFYIRELADDAAWVRTSFNNAGSVSFFAASGSQGRNSARLGAGLNARLSDRMNFRVDYDYEVFDHTAANELSTTFAVRW